METVEKRDKLKASSAAVNVAFGLKLRQVRRAKDVSQNELATRVGLSRVTVATIESGRQNVQIHQAFLFAKALDVPLESLVPSSADVQRQQRTLGGSKDVKTATSDVIFLEDARALLQLELRKAYEQAANKKTN